ncbi:SusD/RagB family nutrient-binding outer membrane lipoprotein [Pedobacter nototheniae]|uniref:SusD/RagB family nutrient-binding outer membrane lipoprotein n=1 Tax=Pedobacter nototheniae TaxID=2488994 RepID=UPI00103AA44D|nr:SusD/RagB family nutrient-binding outer membrane lipoprotein [Pedobacter nototheniae]
MKSYILKITTIIILIISVTGCQKGDLLSNPNVANENSTIPAALLLNHLTWSFYKGGGVVDKAAGSAEEDPFGQVMRWNQFHTSSDSYYRGQNAYAFSNTATAYDLLRYVNKMESQASKQYSSSATIYAALGKFFRAYSFVWLTQRVGDIPMTEAGNPEILQPKFDTQHDVYKNVLQLLEDANTSIAALSSANAGSLVDGDIFGLTQLQWQKVINTYKLRILISLSKRADDNADLNIKSQFAAIIANPVKYPIMVGNGDNLSFKFNATVNKYIYNPDETYNKFGSVSKTYLNITTANQDPRTFIAATPAPAQLAAGKTFTDFSAYVGSDISLTQANLSANSLAGMYSYVNYKRYYTSFAGPEPLILIGYPEMCFNIAEAINRGWLGGSASAWYNNGINASLSFYGIVNGQTYDIGDVNGVTFGKITFNVTDFLNNANVVYKGDNANGLTQILQQKYVAFFENSGWEAFYNWRRTGVPAFANNGPGINPVGKIPVRWQYPVDEINNNSANYKAAIQSQFGGSDDVTKDTWLTK